jgi:hypothetical protein
MHAMFARSQRLDAIRIRAFPDRGPFAAVDDPKIGHVGTQWRMGPERLQTVENEKRRQRR